ncbi:uncharacterized protein LOC119376867 [Rhipicephalus sanguineus]|uniref:uncharacterized protein LOC119376867 n=1 Tax=Rhipicephalus sanguineus TaxID=34632 RepID=UPI001894926B|nr:uncharacterized protein LOC119376867 [Rhipicephalus sanguineus]
MAVAVWMSVLNHIKDKHEGHSVLYPKCQHNELEPRKWLQPGTDAYDKVCSILSNKRLLEDIRQMSPNFQTYGVESFHAIINRFAPKCYAFSYHGILARCQLAALHYNENADRMQAHTQSGELRWQIKHPKARKGDVVACAIKEPPSYGYLSHLLSAVEELVTAGSAGRSGTTSQPPHLSSTYGPVDKAAIVEAHVSRFQM